MCGLDPILRFLSRSANIVVCFRVCQLIGLLPLLKLLCCGWVVWEVSVHDALLVPERIHTGLLRNINECSITLAFIHFRSVLNKI